jgi:hypothetical protein
MKFKRKMQPRSSASPADKISDFYELFNYNILSCIMKDQEILNKHI